MFRPMVRTVTREPTQGAPFDSSGRRPRSHEPRSASDWIRSYVWFVLALLLAGCSEIANSSEAPSIPPNSPSGSGNAPIFTGPRDEYFPLLAECLGNAGFVAEVLPDGSLRYEFGTAAQRPALEAAKAECESTFGVPPPPRPLTESELRQLYSSLVESRECLMGLGYDLPSPPSQDRFIESYQIDPWSPFNDLGITGANEWAELSRTCPQPRID